MDEEDLGQWVQAADGSSERRTTQDSQGDKEGAPDEHGKKREKFGCSCLKL